MRTPKFSASGRQNILTGPLANLLITLVVLLAILAFVLATTLFSNKPASPLQTFDNTITATRELDEDTRQFSVATLTPPCNWVLLVADETDTSALNVNAGEEFNYTWQLKNIGTCDWNADYEVIFISGSDLGGAPARKLGKKVGVGETIEYSLTLRAPDAPGNYVATYELRSDDGTLFGLGNDFNQPLWVSISVPEQ